MHLIAIQIQTLHPVCYLSELNSQKKDQTLTNEVKKEEDIILLLLFFTSFNDDHEPAVALQETVEELDRVIEVVHVVDHLSRTQL